MATIIGIILILCFMSSSCEVHCKRLHQSESDRRHPFLDNNDNNVSFIRILRQVIVDHDCPEDHIRDSNGDCVNAEKYREEKETLDLLTTTTPVIRKVTDDSTITKIETADTAATDTVATDTSTTYKINTVVTNTVATIAVTNNKLSVATNTVGANTGTTETIATNTIAAKTVATDTVAANTDPTIGINHVVVHTVTTNVGKINTIVTTSIMSDTGITDTTTPVSSISTEAEDHKQSQDAEITQIRKTGEDKTDSSSGYGNSIFEWIAVILALLIIISIVAVVSWLMKILYNRYVARQADEEDTISEVSFTTLRESDESSPFMFRRQ